MSKSISAWWRNSAKLNFYVMTSQCKNQDISNDVTVSLCHYLLRQTLKYVHICLYEPYHVHNNVLNQWYEKPLWSGALLFCIQRASASKCMVKRTFSPWLASQVSTLIDLLSIVQGSNLIACLRHVKRHKAPSSYELRRMWRQDSREKVSHEPLPAIARERSVLGVVARSDMLPWWWSDLCCFSLLCFFVRCVFQIRICFFLTMVGVAADQGGNEVRWRPGQETSSGPPNLRSFRAKLLYWRKYLLTSTPKHAKCLKKGQGECLLGQGNFFVNESSLENIRSTFDEFLKLFPFFQTPLAPPFVRRQFSRVEDLVPGSRHRFRFFSCLRRQRAGVEGGRRVHDSDREHDHSLHGQWGCPRDIYRDWFSALIMCSCYYFKEVRGYCRPKRCLLLKYR